jgi:hypothetical protein
VLVRGRGAMGGPCIRALRDADLMVSTDPSFDHDSNGLQRSQR